jgi:demethoxyubiquinone hydroxylase (CLK1/Coq7/Cat5 family)
MTMQGTTVQRRNALDDTSIRKLSECLRGELSAVETYELALKHIDHVGLHRELQDILTSHARRVDVLRERLRNNGADSMQSSGAWGTFAKMLQTGADLLGDRAALAALEEGEDHGIKLYSSDLEGCDSDVRNFIRSQLLPEQQRTHDACRSLKNYVKQLS